MQNVTENIDVGKLLDNWDETHELTKDEALAFIAPCVKCDVTDATLAPSPTCAATGLYSPFADVVLDWRF